MKPPPRRIDRFALLLAVGMLLFPAACGDTASSQPSPTGPAADLQAAATAMKAVTTFHFTAKVVTGSQQTQISGEFGAPNNLHETAQIGSQYVELIRVGSRTVVRSAPSAAWTVSTAASQSAAGDPRAAFGALGSAGDVTISGSTYTFTLTGAAAASLVQGASKVTGTATLTDGRIATLSYLSTTPPVSVVLAYSSFNSAATITLPAGV
ncbi:MAG: hypothetical protein ACHQ0J_03205 [Candidatus Dormibacterales bacterium]